MGQSPKLFRFRAAFKGGLVTGNVEVKITFGLDTIYIYKRIYLDSA